MRKKTKKKEEIKLKDKINSFLDMPNEVLYDIPKLICVGNKEIIIENYKGIIEYDEKVVKINTQLGVIKILGLALEIKNITAEEVLVGGSIKSFEFLS